jgi:hypothetical protein|tara:strand:+ start:187 stop:405 length:219 start_codon:yes stop_codon:yes gene_type:complete
MNASSNNPAPSKSELEVRKKEKEVDMKVQAGTTTEIRPETQSKADQKHRVVSGSHTTQQTQKHLQVPHEIHQ